MEFVEGSPPPPGTPPPARPQWFGPPEDLAGAIVPLERVVARRSDLGLVLTHATVYPLGCQLHLQFIALRDYDDVEATGHRPAFPEIDTDDLHFDLRYPDGAVSSTRRFGIAGMVDHFRVGGSPPGPLLMNLGGGSSGDDRRVCGDRSLWIYPLLPPQVCTLTVEWARLAVPPTDIEIDGAELTAAASRARPLLD
ncbi:hypothetical protein [Actinocrispum sp. NPDC049592]|uniref:hypothetical protein n=1 Tax=Actinocrispum sp. NPDC049592 TaxID=3154835 RepID=UPI0034198914